MINPKQFYFITWVTHGSRISERMLEYKVPRTEGIFLNLNEEIQITKMISEIIKKDDLKVLAFNICGDHVHLLIKIEEEKLIGIVRKLKSISARKFNILQGLTLFENVNKGIYPLEKKKRGITQNHLWGQKFHKKNLDNQKQIILAMEYTKNNRKKHQLEESIELQRIIDYFLINFPKRE